MSKITHPKFSQFTAIISRRKVVDKKQAELKKVKAKIQDLERQRDEMIEKEKTLEAEVEKAKESLDEAIESLMH
ncbi:hypothetical protein FVEN_g12716 [Fusarium venenatum]|uniref:Uncharacterized protein n=1 Tax=Fusarium venenatum TaxID=56646 RepID=A0A2L2TN98_9HYPO|nr:uncharacterized protein FVRRES_06466 [Fusarium venenatum]KAG8359479.1 hypothetical protein FVEN_g12716 [Fusarium venenatum]CEI62030.1 unnamed protein product [Fusarium venenatum]